MSDNIGSIDFTVGLDAGKAPEQAAVAGRVAGEAYGHEFKEGVQSGSSGFMDDLDKLLDKNTTRIEKAIRTNTKKIGSDFDDAGGHVRGFRNAVADAGDDGLWSKLSLNARQAVVIVGAIAAASSDIAVLGSAAGGGLAILGAGLADVGVAGVAAYAAFSGLTGTITDLPKAIQPAAKAFQGIGKALKTVKSNIQVAALSGAAGAFDSIRKTVLGLSPALEGVGKQLGGVIDGFAKDIAPGTDAFKDLNTIIVDAGKQLKPLAAAVGTLGKALLKALANKSVQKGVTDLIGGFQTFSDFILKFVSGEGLTKWMDHTESVFDHLTPLVVAAAKVLNNLVTDKTVKQLDDMLDDLTAFMDPLGGILQDVSNLDIFGLIAQALKEVGDALKPIIKPLGDFFDGVHRVASIAIDEWGKDFAAAVKPLGPILENVGNFLKSLDPKTVKDFADNMAILAAALVGKKLLDGVLGLTGKFANLGKAIDDSGGTGKKFGSKIANTVTAGLAGYVAGAVASKVTDGLTQGMAKVDVSGINVTPAAQGAADQFTGAFAGALAGAKYGGPVGAMVGGFAGALSSVDWGVVTKTLTDPNFKGTQAIEEGLKQGPAFAVINAFKDPTVAAALGDAIGGLFSGLGQSLVDFENGVILPFGQSVGTMFATFFTNTLGMFVDFFTNTYGMFSDFFTNTVGMFVDFFTNTIGMFTDFGVNVGNVFLGIWTTITTIFATISGWVYANVIVPVVGFFAALPGQIGAFIGGIGATIGGWFRTAVSVVSGVVGSIIGFFTGLPGRIGSLIGSIGNTIGGWFRSAESAVSTTIDNIVGFFRDLPSRILHWISGLGDTIANAINPGNILGNLLPKTATGGLFLGPQARVIGEAGPEMVVPLSRPLSQVDPAVRNVAAFAQGKSPVSSSSAGVGKQVYVEAGAIVVSGVNDAGQAADVVLDDLVRKVA